MVNIKFKVGMYEPYGGTRTMDATRQTSVGHQMLLHASSLLSAFVHTRACVWKCAFEDCSKCTNFKDVVAKRQREQCTLMAKKLQ